MNIVWIFYKIIGLFVPRIKHYRYYSGGYIAKKNKNSQVVSYKKEEFVCKNLKDLKLKKKIINIICSGPSLGKIKNKDKLFSHDSLCLNGSHNACQTLQVSIDYYVVSDIGFIRRNWESLCSGIKKSKNLCLDHRALKEIIDKDPRVLYGKSIYLFNLMTRPYGRGLGNLPGEPSFSIDADIGLNPSRTVAYLSLQVAVALGYENIRFFGLDMGSRQRFYKEKNNEKSMIDHDYLFIESDFKFAAQYCREHGIQVINASLDSRLPDNIFKKIDPNDLLG
jgi:hypothetical protein